MVDFRRMIPVLAVIAFLLGSAVTASAQPAFQCFANGGVSTPARSEGLTELVGDLVLNCTGGIPTAFGQPIPQVNVQVFLNTSLTSRLLPTTNGIVWTEALLLLDEPAPANQFACVGTGLASSAASGNGVCSGFGNGTGTGPGYYGSGVPGATVPGVCTAGNVGGCPGNNKNVFQGQQSLGSTNSVTFIGVPIDPPGTLNSRIVRITNVRGNANALGVAGANATPTPIVETISPTPPSFLPVSNPSQTVAFIQKGLSFGAFLSSTSTTALSFTAQQCDNSRASASQAANLSIGVLRYSENFATAFKKRIFTSSSSNYIAAVTAASQQSNLSGQSSTFTVATYNTESGFVSNQAFMSSLPSGPQTGVPSTTAGFADWGTRVKAVFNNIPNGITLFVDTDGVWTGTLGATTATCNNAVSPGIFTTCLDHFSMTATQDGPYTPVARTATSPNGNTTAQLVPSNGTAVAVWEDLDSDNLSFAQVNFGVWVQYTASPGTNSPSLATATVNGSYAPTSTVTTANAASVPRFADTSTASNIFNVVPCLTTLLFPYLTNQAGFDTGIAISATATDPFGTIPQSGTCTLNWYGAAFTGATPTPVVNSGTTYVALLSGTLNNVVGGFSGYMIAVCRFQYAHGFAFISDLGARNLAMGYLALVIPDPTGLITSGLPTRLAIPNPCGGINNISGPLAGCRSTGENLGN